MAQMPTPAPIYQHPILFGSNKAHVQVMEPTKLSAKLIQSAIFCSNRILLLHTICVLICKYIKMMKQLWQRVKIIYQIEWRVKQMQIVNFFSISFHSQRRRQRMFVHTIRLIIQFMMTSRLAIALMMIEQHVMEIQNVYGFFIKIH